MACETGLRPNSQSAARGRWNYRIALDIGLLEEPDGAQGRIALSDTDFVEM